MIDVKIMQMTRSLFLSSLLSHMKTCRHKHKRKHKKIMTNFDPHACAYACVKLKVRPLLLVFALIITIDVDDGSGDNDR